MKPNGATLFLVGFAMLVISMECSAQTADSFEQLQVLVKPGDNVYVTDSTGQTTKGRISQLSATSLGLTVNGARRDLVQNDVYEIRQWKHDSLANGAIIGGSIAGLLSAIAAVAACSEGCRGQGGDVALFILAFTGMGAGIGTGIDALVPSKQTIFKNPGRSSGKLQIRPIINRSNKGVRVAFSF